MKKKEKKKEKKTKKAKRDKQPAKQTGLDEEGKLVNHCNPFYNGFVLNVAI